MPKELGVARRDELMGTFPGEDVERASMLVRFLEGVGQLLPPEAEGKDTEITFKQERTETGLTQSDGNDQSSDTFFEQPVPVIETMGEDLLAPEQVKVDEALPLALDASPEPVLLDAAPDLISPELDNLDEDEDFTDSTDMPSLSGSLPTVAPEPHEISLSTDRDTGLLEMDGRPPELDTTLNLADLGIDPEEDEETNIKDVEEEAEKISPDERRENSDANVRDTVNFYNQTKRMPGTRHITPAEVSAAGTAPLRAPARQEEAVTELDWPQEPEAVSIEPVSLDELSMDSLTENPEFSEMSAELIDEDSSEVTPVVPMFAINDERKDTHKFLVPEVHSKSKDLASDDTADDTAIDAADDTVTEIPSTSHKSPKPEDIRPLPSPVSVGDFLSSDEEIQPEEDASERITPELGRRNDAQELANGPDVRSGESTIDELLQDENTASSLKISTDTNKVTVEPGAVPSHSAAASIVSRQPEEDAAKTLGDETSSAQALPAQGITAREASADDTDSDSGLSDDTSQDARLSSRVRRITDALTRRLRMEKDETEALIEAAEKVAQRLRDTSTESRIDLETVGLPTKQQPDEDPSEAITTRNRAISENRNDGRLGELLSKDTEPTDRDEKDELRRMAAALDRRTERIKESSRKKTEHQTGRLQEQFDAAAETLRHPALRADPPEPQDIVKKERIPTSAIGDLLDRIEDKLGGGAASIEELIEESRKETASISAIGDPYAEMDIDELVAASGRFRGLIDEQLSAEDHHTAKVTVQKHSESEDSLSARTAKISGTPLAKNLDNLWSEVSSRQTGVLQKDKGGRIRQRDEIGIGWTQEALWLTMGAVTVAAAAVASVIMFVVFQLFS